MSDLPTDDDFFASLDAAIESGTRKGKLEAEKKAIANRIRRTDPTRAQRVELAVQLKSINLQLDAIAWRPIASVALFQEQTCSYCGSIHRMFLQFMSKQITTSGAKCIRYIRVDHQDHKLPRETVVHKTRTTMCADCAADFDYDLSSPLTKLGDITEPFAIPADYIQTEEELPD